MLDGLAGKADGWGGGARDNRVSTRELAAFVTANVDRWAGHNRAVRQTPVLLGAEGLTSIANGWARNSTIALLAIASVIGVRSYYRHPPVQDWRGAVSYMAQNAAAGDTVLLPFAHYRMPFDYYHGRFPNSAALRIVVLPTPVGGARRVWLILCDPINPPVAAAMMQLSSLYGKHRETDFQGIKLIEFTANNASRADR